MIAVGALLIGIGAIPPPWALGRILKELTLNNTATNRRFARRKWNEIRKRGYVRASDKSYVLSPRAEEMLNEAELWNLKIEKQKDWDQNWHLVLFDIPIDKNRKRLSFDAILRNLGFVMYQRSVWVYPYPCRGVIEKITKHYGISKYISYATAISLDGQGALMHRFKLR